MRKLYIIEPLRPQTIVKDVIGGFVITFPILRISVVKTDQRYILLILLTIYLL